MTIPVAKSPLPERYQLPLNPLFAILEGYQEHKRFNIQSAEQAKVFFLAKEPKDLYSSELVGEVINHLASEGHVLVFVEGFTAKKILTHQRKVTIAHDFSLNKLFLSNVTFIGLGTDPLHRIHSYLSAIEKLAPGLITDYNSHSDEISPIEADRILSLEAEQVSPVCELIDKLFIAHKQLKKSTPILSRIDTLQTLPQLKILAEVPENTPCVFIGNVKNLKSNPDNLNDLSAFYQELENHPCISLVPPHIRL